MVVVDTALTKNSSKMIPPPKPNPNSHKGLVESFKPVYSFDRRRDGWMMLASRGLVILLIYVGLEELSKTHSMADIEDFVRGSYQDIIEWGESRVMMLDGPGERMALPSFEELEREDAEITAREDAEKNGGEANGEAESGSHFGGGEEEESVEKEEL